jgi:hypothetical protein
MKIPVEVYLNESHTVVARLREIAADLETLAGAQTDFDFPDPMVTNAFTDDTALKSRSGSSQIVA